MHHAGVGDGLGDADGGQIDGEVVDCFVAVAFV